MKPLRKITFLLLLIPSIAAAQAARTFVSAQVGSDANSCGATTPCRSFARAISVTAGAGEIVVLDSGGYGSFSVAQAITIQAPAGVYAGCTTAAGNGATINAGMTDTVTLRGLLFNGLGTATSGVVFNSGAALHIESCVINAFTTSGVTANLAGSVFVNDTIIRNGGGQGIDMGVGTASVNRCRFEKNGGVGIVARSSAQVMASESLAAGNGTGFDAETSGTLNLENCISSGNGAGIVAGAATSTVRVSNSIVTNNTTGLTAGGGSLLSRQNNMVEGNGTDGVFTGTIAAK